jgi:hypothetical protein
MDYNKRFDQIESILTDVLRVQTAWWPARNNSSKDSYNSCRSGTPHPACDRQARAVEQLVELGRTHHESWPSTPK